ncbi:protein FAR1-RELATED SEQUENCE 5-like [Silene latifolia]|uniref:protein FAR1-RELATED SEQUENCE 5-like n=1 Tax=Silene latifolia TaxID=37657 RepID=UPI003D7790D6
MMFTPFTGVDHNKKTITFAAGLLEFESQDSFEWIFTKFLEAMGQQRPQCIITYQCPEIKKACPNIFKNPVHKYCIWHIMQKVPEKVGRAICNDKDLMTDINGVVWDVDLEPEEFEQNWQTVIEAHEQQRHSQRRMDTANEYSMLEKVGPMKYHDVRDGLKHRNFLVEFNIQTNESKCACKLFERHGIVCRHILWVWNGRQVYKIPEPYVLARWTKKSYRPIVQDETGNVIEDIDEADIKKAEMSKVWFEIYATVRVMDTYATVK